MKTGSLIIFLSIIFCFIAIPAMASVEVGHVNIKPSGDLESGKSNVTADLQMSFISVGGETFPSDESISLKTELENPVWTYSIILDGVENPRPAVSKKQLDLSGWELSYENVDESVKVNLKGMAPKVDSSRQIEVVSVNVATPGGRVKETVKNVTAFVTNPGELKGDITSVKESYSKLEKDIAQNKADGIDVSKAEAKAKEALNSLNSAAGASYSNAQVYIKNANTFIKDAYSMLDMGVSQKAINEVKEAIDKTDEWINYFKTEKEMGSDPRLAPIITKREFAAEDASDAKELFDAGKYTDARKKAEEAYQKANEVFEATQELQTEVESAPKGPELPDLSGIIPYIVGIIVVAIVGFILYRVMKNRGGKGGGKGGGGGGSFGSRDKPRKKSTVHQYDELF
ncbi:hypothetical protein KHC33_06190 [Methanospirillum sp. J.3.6.1-F.2.7.3]|uniref:Uncharacterized protein n=1 Tax=Methanospirillum purgamenti TaxID=2834276 RepID=A0A8E7B455_9EURY|nr:MULTISPECIES: hypothetical protein [Methanospirillum]MDX8549949.1 hypothetical protein [Methanospirillum hungatei]QVV90081.1 hypothetical protein KHC33_06190 [Methanospirillum sp. J.3.6.1-F.2.7.3]